MSLTRSTQASGLIYAAESGSNAQISDFFDALYFGLTTLTTVGFGDITPVTPVGRLIVSASVGGEVRELGEAGTMAQRQNASPNDRASTPDAGKGLARGESGDELCPLAGRPAASTDRCRHWHLPTAAPAPRRCVGLRLWIRL